MPMISGNSPPPITVGTYTVSPPHTRVKRDVAEKPHNAYVLDSLTFGTDIGTP